MEKQVEGKRSSATLELLKLAEENPERPIIAEVDSEVVAEDGYMFWFGEVTGACVEYVLAGEYHSWTLSEALMENDAFVEENAPEALKQKLEKLNDADFDKEANEWIKSLPWKKCILVYVDVPDHIVPELEI